MRLLITHLKAPWPRGARVGDVIELPVVPAWALGKCSPAPEGAEVTLLSDAEQAEALRLQHEEEDRRVLEEQERAAREAEEQRRRDTASTVTGDDSGTPLPPIDPAAVAPGAVEPPAAEVSSAPARKTAATRKA